MTLWIAFQYQLGFFLLVLLVCIGLVILGFKSYFLYQLLVKLEGLLYTYVRTYVHMDFLHHSFCFHS